MDGHLNYRNLSIDAPGAKSRFDIFAPWSTSGFTPPFLGVFTPVQIRIAPWCKIENLNFTPWLKVNQFN